MLCCLSLCPPTGYPKYITSNWMLTQNATSTGILAAFLGPSTVSVTVDDPTYGTNTITIDSVTDYPLVLNAGVQYVVQAEHPFGFSMRVPGWAAGAQLVDEAGTAVDVANGTIYTYEYSGGGSVKLTLSLPYSLRTVRRYNNAVSIYYGPLLLALDFSYNTTVLQRYEFNSSDLQYLPIDQVELRHTNGRLQPGRLPQRHGRRRRTVLPLGPAPPHRARVGLGARDRLAHEARQRGRAAHVARGQQRAAAADHAGAVRTDEAEDRGDTDAGEVRRAGGVGGGGGEGGWLVW